MVRNEYFRARKIFLIFTSMYLDQKVSLITAETSTTNKATTTASARIQSKAKSATITKHFVNNRNLFCRRITKQRKKQYAIT